ncbi:hypothetical protein FRX31_009052 [Thalictrum thalictroides]|uniref:Uncharacterized protein n=1 Tax=Thalictrum thalictroides TaxID=46969 RepID=A0A7J6WVB7_THATH|nr:hypothetical protein FRX31_009052 [Thalictrum thalictroides]
MRLPAVQQLVDRGHVGYLIRDCPRGSSSLGVGVGIVEDPSSSYLVEQWESRNALIFELKDPNMKQIVVDVKAHCWYWMLGDSSRRGH